MSYFMGGMNDLARIQELISTNQCLMREAEKDTFQEMQMIAKEEHMVNLDPTKGAKKDIT